MATKFKIGDTVRVTDKVTRLHALDRTNPDVMGYLGQEGVVIMFLPREWDFEPMYRIDFGDPRFPRLAFFGRELVRV